jgi:hypothetical protein
VPYPAAWKSNSTGDPGTSEFSAMRFGTFNLSAQPRIKYREWPKALIECVLGRAVLRIAHVCQLRDREVA